MVVVERVSSGKTKTKILSQKLDEKSWRDTWLYTVFEINRVDHTVKLLLEDSYSYQTAIDLVHDHKDD